MTCRMITPFSLLLLLMVINARALDNGLAKTPPMGWNSWNIFHGDINEDKIEGIADAMVSTGMKDAGYIYLTLDDNWMSNPARDSEGNLQGDPRRFPGGMKKLGDYIHSKGLKFGIYGDHGTATCMGVRQSGSHGTEERDARTLASWGVDYLKFDNCNIPQGTNIRDDYEKMRDALAECGRPIVYSICAWEFQSWMPETGNLWRTTNDITDNWEKPRDGWYLGIPDIIDQNEPLAEHASPGAWNDPDMLEVGNGGCTDDEYRAHMSIWCIMAAPLIAGNDIRSMSQATKDILLNSEVIAVDQDSAGIQGKRITSDNGREVWCKPLGSEDGATKAVVLFNRNQDTENITVHFSDIDLSGEVTVRDLWAGEDKGEFTGSYTMPVPSHGACMLKISSESTISKLENRSNRSGGLSHYTIQRVGSGIVVSLQPGHSGRFTLSVYRPDGRLLTSRDALGTATVSSVSTGVVLIEITENGNYFRNTCVIK